MNRKPEKVPIEQLAEILSGYAFKSELFNEKKGMRVIRIRCFKEQN